MSSPLGSLCITSGSDETFPAPSDGHKAILIGNESGLTVTITMESGGVSKTLYPGVLDWFAIKKGFTGNIKIHPITILNNVSSWPASSLVFDAIGLQDPEDASMYPISFNRNTNIGNNVNTVGGISTAIQNDNNVVPTSIMEATPAGDGASAVSLTNAGVFTLGNSTHPGSISFDNGTITSNGFGNISIGGIEYCNEIHTGHLMDNSGDNVEAISLTTGGNVEVHGTLTADKYLSISVGVNGDLKVTGSTSGTAVLWQPRRGDVKEVQILLSSTYNSTVKTFALPTAFSDGAHIFALGNSGPMRFLSGGVAQTVAMVTGFTAGGMRNFTNVTTTPAGGCEGWISAGFDTIELSATGSVGPSHILIIGS
jgi:hypothetical protein